jgi:hypothetical protein
MVCKHSGFSYKPNLYRLHRHDPKKVFIPYVKKIHFWGDCLSKAMIAYIPKKFSPNQPDIIIFYDGAWLPRPALIGIGVMGVRGGQGDLAINPLSVATGSCS